MTKENGKKTLSILLLVLMTLAMIPALGVTFNKSPEPEERGLGDVIDVVVGEGQDVTVVDTLPPEFKYVAGTFMVDDVPATPGVGKMPPPPPISQIITYNLGSKSLCDQCVYHGVWKKICDLKCERPLGVRLLFVPQGIFVNVLLQF